MCTLFVSRLSNSTTEETLLNYFRKFGNIQRLKIIKNYAFVTFFDERDARNAVNYSRNKEIDGSLVNINYSFNNIQNQANCHSEVLYIKPVPQYISWQDLKELCLRYVPTVFINLREDYGSLSFVSLKDKMKIMKYYDGYIIKKYQLRFYDTPEDVFKSCKNEENNSPLRKREFSNDSCECTCHFDTITFDRKSNKVIMKSETKHGNSTVTRTIEKKRKKSRSPVLSRCAPKIRSLVRKVSSQENENYSSICEIRENVVSRQDSRTHEKREVNYQYQKEANTLNPTKRIIEGFIGNISTDYINLVEEEDYNEDLD